MSIRDFDRKIKGFWDREGEALLLALVVFLVGVGSFGLGYLAGKDTKSPENPAINNVMVSTEIPLIGETSSSTTIADSGLAHGPYVASRSGTVYYPSGCKAAERIHEENRIYFSSSSDAELAGYKPSTACDTSA